MGFPRFFYTGSGFLQVATPIFSLWLEIMQLRQLVHVRAVLFQQISLSIYTITSGIMRAVSIPYVVDLAPFNCPLLARARYQFFPRFWPKKRPNSNRRFNSLMCICVNLFHYWFGNPGFLHKDSERSNLKCNHFKTELVFLFGVWSSVMYSVTCAWHSNWNIGMNSDASCFFNFSTLTHLKSIHVK